jgi:poly-gamma-glutamate capsule biosynthesis protein CapA/YwtB (metallophosphatase superfamily)
VTKRLKICSFGAVAVLAGCVSGPPQTPATTAEVAAVEPAVEVVKEITPDYASMRITVAGAGDIMLGTDFPENHLPDDDGVAFLAAVTPVLSGADIAFGNLEGVLLDGGEPAKKCSNPKSCYMFRSPTHYAEYLKAAGFDIMSLANNHARDFGEAGRNSSMAALDAVGILHSGREGEIASWQENGLQIAMIAFSPTVGSWPLLSIDIATEAVSKLVSGHDIIIVSFHGGAEGFDGAEHIGFGMEYAYGEARGDVVKFAHAVIEAGADLVIGHGPHVPRAMELYKDRLIAYSLGNFATYYGISVAGVKGYAPVVIARLDGYGRFLDGELHSNIQIRPGGPQPDPKQNALQMIRQLTLADFPQGQLNFSADGRINIQPQSGTQDE